MNARRLIGYLLLNALVSAAVTLTVLWLWDRAHTPAPLASVANQPALTATGTPGLPPVTPYPTPLPPTPPMHTVRSGETLGDIAQQYNVSVADLMRANNLTDPNVLSVGQALVIPVAGFDPTATPAPTLPTVPPLATATPNPNAPPAQLTIRDVQAAGNLAAEVVIVANAGGPVDLAGWTLRDEAGHAYTFPALTLFEGGIVNVHTRAGQDSVIDLYWGRADAAWAVGRLVLLADPSGAISARFKVP